MPRHAVSALVLLGALLGSVTFGAMTFGGIAPALARKAPPPAPPPIDQTALAGSWIGTYAGGGFTYNAIATLVVDATGNISGTIVWTLHSTPSGSGKDKIGMRAIEYVSGKYYPETEAVALDGYRKDDPNGIWESDKYRLILSPTHSTMGGITSEHESWAGQLFLHRDAENTQ
jgi:hypothetical protein